MTNNRENNRPDGRASNGNRKSMLPLDPDTEFIGTLLIFESAACMPIEAVNKELQLMGCNVSEPLPEQIIEWTSAQARQAEPAVEEAYEPVPSIQEHDLSQSASHLSGVQLVELLRLKWLLNPLVSQFLLFMFSVLCTSAILMLVTYGYVSLLDARSRDTHGHASTPLPTTKSIYIKASDDDPLSVQVRNDITDELQSRRVLTVTDKIEYADAILKIFVKQKTNSKEYRARSVAKNNVNERADGPEIALINVLLVDAKGGGVIWPVSNDFDRSYTGPVKESIANIVNDLLRDLQGGINSSPANQN